jgi:hypothetical protein
MGGDHQPRLDAPLLPRHRHPLGLAQRLARGLGAAGRLAASDGELLGLQWPPARTTWLFMYDPEMARETPSRVTWEIEDLGGSCRLTVTHDRLEAAPRTEAVVKGGWSAILDGLRQVLEAA